MSESLLTACGKRAWLAETPEDYVELAAGKAGDLQALAAMRRIRFRLDAGGNPCATSGKNTSES
jgi:predicted O-linked N-acetylglucosamine transferase (SPINDLY family)